ncbi:single-stranded DNA-binding protein [Chloropicon primus]|nr:single-stranded DNA-binding protein [Chloropicon primus]
MHMHLMRVWLKTSGTMKTHQASRTALTFARSLGGPLSRVTPFAAGIHLNPHLNGKASKAGSRSRSRSAPLGLGLRAYNASSSPSSGLEEVEWQAENANAVTLIGRLGREPEVKYLENGKVTANVSLAVSRGKNQSAHWFELDFWDEDARLVADNCRKGQQVQVQGRLTQNTWRDKMTGQKKEKVRVVCNRVALVAGGAQGGGDGGFDSFQGGLGGKYSPSGGRGGGAVASKDLEGRWAALFCSPGDFWDNRATKKNPRAPDFKHKETGEALWIESRGTPAWVASSLKELDMNKQVDINSLFTQQQQGGGGPPPPSQHRGGNQEEIPF